MFRERRENEDRNEREVKGTDSAKTAEVVASLRAHGNAEAYRAWFATASVLSLDSLQPPLVVVVAV